MGPAARGISGRSQKGQISFYKKRIDQKPQNKSHIVLAVFIANLSIGFNILPLLRSEVNFLPDGWMRGVMI